MNDTTATISSAAGLQEQARPPDWRETEYKELNNTGRALYDAYFKLATMTFTWNASLFAGIIFAFSNPEKLETLILLAIAIVIPLIAIVYNRGALGAFSVIGEAFREIPGAMDAVSVADSTLTPAGGIAFAGVKHLQIPRILRMLMRDSGFGHWVSKLTVTFFSLLMFAWGITMVAAIVFALTFQHVSPD